MADILQSSTRARDWAALIFALTLPTLVTLAYFVLAGSASEGVQQATYAIAKTIQFVFPVFWVYIVQKQRPALWPVSFRGAGLGLAFGAIVMLATLAGYYGWLKSSDLFAAGTEPMRNKLLGLGLDHASEFIGLGVFYSICHSFLEEYYWRWFVFDQLRRLTAPMTAIVISSLGFMAHHVLVVSEYFGPLSGATWLFSLAVALGGAFWAWLYYRSGSLIGPWLSHLLVDAGIFLVGYDICREVLVG